MREIELFDVPETRACVPNNKTADNTGTVAGHLKNPTFENFCHMHEQFNDLYQGRKQEHPKHWNVTPYTGLPKEKDAETPNQWYSRTWREDFRRGRNNVTNVPAYGFMKGSGIDPIINTIKTTVRKAFDYKLDIVLDQFNIARGIPLEARIAALLDYINKEGFAKINGMDETERFPCEGGARQGGVRTPDEFRELIKQTLSPLLTEWKGKGEGFKMPNQGFLEDNTYALINLITFADNFTLFASSYVQRMMDDMTARIEEVGLTWKVRKNKKGEQNRTRYHASR